MVRIFINKKEKRHHLFLHSFFSKTAMEDIRSCFRCRTTFAIQWRSAQPIHFDHFGVVKLRHADDICNSCHAEWYKESQTVSFKPFVRLAERVCGDESGSKMKAEEG